MIHSRLIHCQYTKILISAALIIVLEGIDRFCQVWGIRVAFMCVYGSNYFVSWTSFIRIMVTDVTVVAHVSEADLKNLGNKTLNYLLNNSSGKWENIYIVLRIGWIEPLRITISCLWSLKETWHHCLSACLPLKDNSGRWVYPRSSNGHIGLVCTSLALSSFLPPLLESWNLLSCKPLLFTSLPLPSVWMGITSARLWQGGSALLLLESKSWISHLVRSAFKLLHFSEDVAAGWFLTPW